MTSSTTNYNVKEQEPAAEDIQIHGMESDPEMGIYGMKKHLLAFISPNKSGTILDDIKFILYLIALFVLIIGILGNSPKIGFWCKNHVCDSIANTNFQDGVKEINFYNISSIPQFWKFAETVMIDSIYGKSEKGTHQAFVLQDSKLVGAPRLRQVRSIKLCYEPYLQAYEDTKPFGPGNGTAWTYSTAEELGGSSHRGFFSSYGGGGYYEDLSLNRSETIKKLLTLKNNQWITGRTSAIFLDLIVYSANVDAIFTVKLLIEPILRQGVVKSYYGNTVKLHRLVTAYDYFVAVCECMFVAFIFYYNLKWIVICVVKEYRYVDPASDRVILRVDSAFELLSLPILLCGYAVICFRIYSYVVIEPPIIQNISEEKLGNLDSSRLYEAFYVILSVLLLNSAWPKIFRYTSFKHASSLVKYWREITVVSVVIIVICVTCLQIINWYYCGYRFHLSTSSESVDPVISM